MSGLYILKVSFDLACNNYKCIFRLSLTSKLCILGAWKHFHFYLKRTLNRERFRLQISIFWKISGCFFSEILLAGARFIAMALKYLNEIYEYEIHEWWNIRNILRQYLSPILRYREKLGGAKSFSPFQREKFSSHFYPYITIYRSGTSALPCHPLLVGGGRSDASSTLLSRHRQTSVPCILSQLSTTGAAAYRIPITGRRWAERPIERRAMSPDSYTAIHSGGYAVSSSEVVLLPILR